MVWTPHVTVATVITQDDRFLFVEEEIDGHLVLNQPAGHLEEGESLCAAAQREVLEETRWHVEISKLLNISLYTAPGNGITYLRVLFSGNALWEDHSASLDSDISRVLWLTYTDAQARAQQMRSPLVLQAIEHYRSGQNYPLSMLDNTPAFNKPLASGTDN